MNIKDVARGLLVDAFITYAAICREKGYEVSAFVHWRQALSDMRTHINVSGTQEMYVGDALLGESDDEHVEALIDERRGLIRDTMREELADLEAACTPPEDLEGIRDERQG